MTSRKQLRELNPAVVQQAIGFAEDHNYSCHALLRADVGDRWIYVRLWDNPYTVAYEHYTIARAGGEHPHWWNSCQSYVEDRIQALEDFRDAIIQAKKPTLWERAKAWLASLCEIPHMNVRPN